MSDFNKHICDFFFKTDKVKQIAYSKVTKKDTKVLSEYHNMASWNRKEINVKVKDKVSDSLEQELTNNDP